MASENPGVQERACDRKQSYELSELADLRLHRCNTARCHERHNRPVATAALKTSQNPGQKTICAMSALPPLTDVGRRIQVSIWLSVCEYTP